METPGLWLRTICLKNGLKVGDDQIRLLEEYGTQLINWNRKINLISRQDVDFIWQNHILHSISPLFKLKLQHPSAIMDMGTGGGLPGIPLKILMPDLTLLLVDATRKKVNAVQDIVRRLGLDNTEALWGRAEELAKQQNLLSQFDYIVARAVAPLGDLISWSKPFLRSAEMKLSAEQDWRPSPPALVAFKGGDLDEEIAEAKRKWRIESVDVVNLVFPGSEEISSGGKKLVIVRF